MAFPSFNLPFGPKEVKDRLVGVERWLVESNFISVYNDDNIRELIPQQIRRFEEEVMFRIVPVQVIMDDDGTYTNPANPQMDATNTYETYTEAPYPYYQDQSQAYLRTQLRQYPVRSVQRLRLVLDPVSNVVAEVPTQWFRFEPKTGIFHIMPVTGSISIVGIATAYAVIQAQFGTSNFVPQMLAFDYMAGLPDDWYTMREWGALKRVLTEYCAWAVLNDICEQFDPGLSNKSVSGDGVNTAYAYERFVRRRGELWDSVQRFQATMTATNTPFFLDAV